MTILCLAIWLLFVAQTATTPTPPPGPPAVQTPSNAQERMDLAKKMNGLHGMTVPWHLKATYELFAPDGKSSDKGTYEEWWVSEKKYRIAYHSPALVVEEFGTDHGIFRTGQQPWPRSPLSAIRAMITQPVFPATISQKTTFENFQRDFGTRKLPCTAITTSGPERPIQESFFCFSPTNAVLLYASTFEGAYQTLFQDMRVVNGQHLAYTMQRFLAGKPWLTVHVETVEGLGDESLAALNVPDGAAPTVKRLTETKEPI
jgi:hypothetical protein